MANRVTQVAVEVLVRSTPRGRVTQTPTESLVSGSPTSRVSQVAIEVLAPNTGTAVGRVSQAGLEVALITASGARVTQAGVEVALITASSGLVTQAGLEVVLDTISAARISQAGIEVVIPAHRQFVPASASFVIRLLRTVPVSGFFRQTFGRPVLARAIFTQHQARPVPRFAYFRQTFSRTVPASASIGVIRIVPARASIGTRPRVVPATARIGSINRTVIARAVFIQRLGRVVPARAEIGYRRYVLARAIFLGFPRRNVPAFGAFSVGGIVPARGTFWFPIRTWDIWSDGEARVMSLASHLVGGSVGSRFGLPSANNAPVVNNSFLTNFDQFYYDDSFWPHPVTRHQEIMPTANPDERALEMAFNWAWPNETNDYAGGSNDPSFGFDLYRRSFGLPNDQRIVDATSGKLTVSIQLGVFNAEIALVRMNGFNLPFLGYTFGAGDTDNLFGINFGAAARVGEWVVPSNTLRPGSNVLTLMTETELTFGLGSRATAFLLTLNYNPARPNTPQIIG